MSEVVNLPTPKLRIWICDCGCSSFKLAEDGTAICANCEVTVKGAGGGWLDHVLDATATTVEPEAVFSSVQGNGSEEFVKRRLSRLAADDDAALVVVARRSGMVSTWHDAEDKDQLNWVLRRLAEARKLVTQR